MSIRLRLAIVFAVASAILLALGGWLFVSVLSSSLMNSIDSQLAAQASHGSTYLSSNSAIPTSTLGTNAPEYVVQVIDGANRIRATSAEAPSQPILSSADLRRARTQPVLVTQVRNREHERVLAQPLVGRGGWIVVAGVSLESFDATISRVTTELTIGCALFVLIAALGAYALAKSALRPVERLRREVAELSERDVPDSVGVPGTHDEIAALASTMNELLLRVRSSLERERNLVADASHELRTPFAVLRGELELAQRPGRTHDELLAAVGIAADEAARLTRIADDLLLLSRGDQGQLPMHLKVINVQELLMESAKYAENRLRAHEITCRVEVPSTIEAKVDPGRIRQAIDNLIDNATRCAPANTAIVLSARTIGEDLELEVTDDGPGFTTDFLPHAFERFRRPDTSRSRDDGGAGLGLAIVMTIAVAHGGTATAGNRSQGGASVRLRLPGAVVNG